MMENLDFRKAIFDKITVPALTYCYQCNKCTEMCIVAKIVGEDVYNPRKLVLHSFLGNKANVMPSGPDDMKVWGCTYCDTCDEVCPNGIELTEIFYLIKNMLAKKKQLPEFYTIQATTIRDNGKAIPLMDAIVGRRERMGLGKLLEPDVNKVKTIMKETGMDEII